MIRDLAGRLARRFREMLQASDEPPDAGGCEPGVLHYRCNICELRQWRPLESLRRDEPSCSACGSTGRWRVVVESLSTELFGRSLTLREFPVDLRISGLGIGDWPGYADVLSSKLSYRNTFFEREPRLDLHAIDTSYYEEFDFAIASDVLEHVVPPVSRALENLFRVLKPGGFLLLTVPYRCDSPTVEHFPELHDYRLDDRDGELVLVNTTTDGRKQEYRDLLFHGGYGNTLEMRLFGETGLREELLAAGFGEVTILDRPNFEFGIYWSEQASFPVIARREAPR